jgi:drug/metabolite transporter (DMT)-like permease
MWVGLALGAALLTSLIPIIVKRLLHSVEVPVVIWAAQVTALPLLAAFAFGVFGVPVVVPGFFALATVIVLLNTGAHLGATAALKAAEASLVAPLLAVSPAITLLLGALWLGNYPSVNGSLGVFCIISGAYVIQLETWQAWQRPWQALRRERGPQLALVAAGLWGLTPLLEQQAIQHTLPTNPPFVPLVTTIGVSLLLFPIIVRSPSRLIDQVRRAGAGLALVGVISGIAPVLGFSALRLGLAGYVTALFALRTAFIILWSVLLLQERPRRWRWVGVALLVIGAIAISQ